MARPPSAARILFLLVVAGLLAALANLAAPAHRKLAWVGNYPRAMQVGAPVTAPPAVASPVGREPDSVPTSAPAAAPPSAPPAAAVADSGKVFPPHPDKAAVEIGPEDVELLYHRKALFLDARRSSVYAEGHIAGARSFPVWEADVADRVKALYEEGRNQQDPIVVYCSGGNCEDSHMLAEKLYMVGFDNVLIYKEGFPDWQQRGLPVAKGAGP